MLSHRFGFDQCGERGIGGDEGTDASPALESCRVAEFAALPEPERVKEWGNLQGAINNSIDVGG